MGEGLKLVGSLVCSLVGKPVGGALNRFGGVDRWGWASEVRINTWEWEVVGGVGGGWTSTVGASICITLHLHLHTQTRALFEFIPRAVIQDLLPPPHPLPTTIPNHKKQQKRVRV